MTRRPVAAVAFVVFALLVLALASCSDERGSTPAGGVGSAPGAEPTPPPTPLSTPPSSPASTSPSVPEPTSSAQPTPPPLLPRPTSIVAARRWLQARQGVCAFAVIDSHGEFHGWRANRRFSSASVVKAMLLVQYLRSHGALSPGERRDLRTMIDRRENGTTDRVYAHVGGAGLLSLARAAHMTRFTPSSDWPQSQITAADQVRFFFRLNDLVPKRHRRFALRLLAELNELRGWGMPEVALHHSFRVYFKDGWIPTASGQLVCQVVRVERDRVVFATAVLTDGQPTPQYGVDTIAGFGARLFRGAP